VSLYLASWASNWERRAREREVWCSAQVLHDTGEGGG
jgi:hypothetical protein